MAPTMVQIMDGLETALATIPGLRVAEYKPEAITPPQAIVGVPPIKYHQTMGNGLVELDATVTVLTSKTYTRAGQRQLAAFADPTGTTSVRAAIEADQTLGGVVLALIVDSFDPIGESLYDTIGYFGGVFTIRIQASGI